MLVSSCSSKREALSSVYESVVDSTINSIVQERKITNLNGIDKSIFKGEIIITEIEYDTNTPIDSISGKPVIKKEKSTTISINGENDVNVKVESKEEKDNASIVDVERKENVRIEKELERDSVSWLSYIYKIFEYSLLLIVFVLIYRFVSRFSSVK